MKKILLISMLAFLSWSGRAQTGVTSYTTPAGFGGARNCLRLDPFGNKWFGTNLGLVKFDGTNFTKYDTLNSGIPDEYVYDVAFDASNNMWVGTRKGLTKYNGSSWTTYNTSNSNIPNDTVTCIITQGSNIYIGTKNGIGILTGSSWTNFNSVNSGLSTRLVNCLAIDLNTDLFVGTNVGLFRKSGATWTNLSTINTYYSSVFSVYSIYVDAANSKWVGSTNSVLLLSGNSLVSISTLYPNYGLTFLQISGYSIIKGPLGGIMFASSLQGLIEVANGTIYSYTGLNIGNTRHLVNDNNGLIWSIYFPGSSISSFNYSNYTLTNPIQQSIPIPKQEAFLDINDVKALILNRGDMFWDVFGSTNARYEVPKGTGRNAQFSSALWIGGIDNGGALHTAAQTYRQTGNDYWPGPVDTLSGTIDSSTSANFDRLWKLDRLNINQFRTQFALGNVQNGSYAVDSNIITWPAIGTGNFTRKLAPFIDVNHDGLYRPLIDGDYPDIKGDQMIYWIFNDALAAHGETGGLPLGVEVHGSAYAYYCPTITDSLDVLNYSTFYNFKIVNRSSNNYHNTQLGFWDDMDLGYFADDFVGCNPAENYGMALNGTNVDGSGQSAAYGIKPPMNSTVILNGPMAEPNDSIDNNNDGTIDEVGEKNLMTSFLYFNNDWTPNGNPQIDSDYYNYMTAHWKNGRPLTYGGNGYLGTIPTKFMFDGALNDTIGWSEPNILDTPADRRFVMGCGPFNLNAGQMVEFDIAQVFTRDTISAYSIGNLFEKNRDDVKRVKQWFAVDSFPSCLTIYTGIQEHSSIDTGEVSIYPNPSTGLFQIQSQLYKIQKVEVFNLLGEIIYQSQVNNHQSIINLCNFDKGIYFVQVTDERKNSINKKIIVQ